jgi:hypothetical protein
MTIAMRNSKLHVLLVMAIMVVSASSFNIPLSHQKGARIPFSSFLQATQVDSDEPPLPNWTELPLKREDELDLAPVEIGLGRLAMLGFFGLLAVEMATGESFSEQILDVVRLFR